MKTPPKQFVPLHGPMMCPPNPKAALWCIGIAFAITLGLMVCMAH